MLLLQELLIKAEDLCSGLDGSVSPGNPSEFRGMGAVSLLFDPYERKWLAKANWSDSSEVMSAHYEDPMNSVADLIDLLRDDSTEGYVKSRE